jgi:hypothetical protein
VRGPDVIGLELRIIRQNLLVRPASREQFQELNGEARSLDERLAHQHLRFETALIRLSAYRQSQLKKRVNHEVTKDTKRCSTRGDARGTDGLSLDSNKH